MGAALALNLMLTDFSIELAGLAVAVGYVGLCEGLADANARSPARGDPRVTFMLGGTAQIVLIATIMTPLTYVEASASLPLQHSSAFTVARALRFGWTAYLHDADDHPALAAWLSYGYTMIRWSFFAIPLVLAAKGCFRRIEEFTFAFGLALIAITIVSALVPAIGGGIVTIPSFHAASAVLYVWALWPLRWTRPVVALAFGAMLASTPIIGGQSFSDVVAGAAIALLAIFSARGVGRIVARRRVVAAASR